MRKNASREVTADDVIGPGAGSAPGSILTIAWKFARILGVSELPDIVIRNNLSSRWLGRCHFRFGKRNLIELQKRVLHDTRTLERVIAHEMAHHAEFLAFTEREHALIRAGRRTPSHGAVWQAFADKINRVMDADYVTIVSNESHVLAPSTKPFLVLIAKTRSGRLGFAVGVRFSPKMMLYVRQYGASMQGRLIQSTDPRWSVGPRVGSGKLGMPMKSEDVADLQALYEKASPVGALDKGAD